jgi:hypothetical protein
MGTSSNVTAAAPAAPANPFEKLSVDELNQAIATVSPSLQALATDDGSTTSVMGQWLSLQGAFVSNLSLFQKIGVNDLAAASLALLQQAQAKAVAAIQSGS